MSMKKQSLKNRMLAYLKRQNCFVNGGELERLALSNGYKASNISRRARECAELGVLERKEEKGIVWYKYNGIEKTISVPVFQDNGTVRFDLKVIKC